MTQIGICAIRDCLREIERLIDDEELGDIAAWRETYWEAMAAADELRRLYPECAVCRCETAEPGSTCCAACNSDVAARLARGPAPVMDQTMPL